MIMKTKKAFFDVDGTIYQGSTSHDSINYLNEMGIIDTTFYSRYWDFNTAYKEGKLSYQEVVDGAMRTLMSSLNNLSISNIEVELKQYLINNNKIYPYVNQVIDFLQRNNYEIFLISAGIDPAIKAIAEYLGINNFYTSTQKVLNGKYTDQDIHILHSSDKEEIINSLLNDIKHSESINIGWGDTTGDKSMLSQVDLAFVVNPHQQEMLDLSKENNWIVTSDASIMFAEIAKLESD